MALDLSCPQLLESRPDVKIKTPALNLKSVSLRFASERCDVIRKQRDSFCTPFAVTAEAGLHRRFWRVT